MCLENWAWQSWLGSLSFTKVRESGCATMEHCRDRVFNSACCFTVAVDAVAVEYDSCSRYSVENMQRRKVKLSLIEERNPSGELKLSGLLTILSPLFCVRLFINRQQPKPDDVVYANYRIGFLR